jgi:hypothetical protein
MPDENEPPNEDGYCGEGEAEIAEPNVDSLAGVHPRLASRTTRAILF